MKVNWRVIVALFFVGLVLLVQIFYWLDPITFSDIIALRDELISASQQYPIIAGVSYILIYTLSIIFGLPISVTIIGGYLFGLVKGTLYSIIAIAFGTFFLCIFARYLIPNWIKKTYQDQLKGFNKEIEKNGFYYLLSIHAVPFMPSFLPHVAAGLSNMSLYKIVVANMLGALPLTIVYVVAGTYIGSVESFTQLFYFLLIFGSIIGSLALGTLLVRVFVMNK